MVARSTPAITSASLRRQIRIGVIEAIAEVRATTVDALMPEIEEAGDEFEIDSKEAEVVLSILEYRLEQELARTEDLKPEQLTTLSALTDLVARRYEPA